MTKLWKLLQGSLHLAASLGVAAALSVGAASAKEYKIAHSGDAQHPNHLALVEMAKRVAERTKNEITFKIFPNNELGSPPEQTEQLRLGVLDFAILSPSQLDKYGRAFGVVFIPISSTTTLMPTGCSTKPRINGCAPMPRKPASSSSQVSSGASGR